MLWNALLLALRAIRRNLLRSFLTILGVVIGVAAVVTMVTLGNGATQSISDQISSMGSNLLMVIPGQGMGPGSSGVPDFKTSDVTAIRERVSSAALVSPVVRVSSTAIFQSKNWSTSVSGTSNEFFEAGNWVLAEGRIFTEAEQKTGRTVCVIGETVRTELFGSQNPIGTDIRIGRFSCTVIGLLEAKGQSAMGTDQDDTVIMPMRTVQRRLAGTQDVQRIMVSVQPGASIEETQEKITLLLRERRNISELEEDDFMVMDTREIAQTLTGTTRILTMLLGAVAAVSLLVGGIGIMNIMLVSVTERTQEIGIRLAIGALERDVLLQFLIEAGVLSSMGGIAGLLLAAVTSMVLANVMQIPYLFDQEINVLAFLVSAGIGVVFGYFPARRAARLDPIDALRHE